MAHHSTRQNFSDSISRADPRPATYLTATPDIIAGAAASLAIPFLSSLSLIPLYHLARALWDDRAARLTILLYAFIPALTVFMPVFDDAFTLITSLTLYFTVNGIKNQNRSQLFLAGLIGGAGLFASFGLLPLLLISNLYLLFSSRAIKSFIYDSATLAIGGVTVWSLAWITFGLNPFIIYSNSMSEHAILTTTRSYWAWLIYNPYDILLFAGIPISILFLGSVIRCCRQLFVERSPSSADHLLIAFVITFSLILISGNLRGETARVLLYVQPLIILFAAYNLTLHSSRITFFSYLILALTLLQTILFQTTLSVYH
ncbi:MAG: glycosyltransferase family 39 protein [Chloroflexi bacterium]|nr:glycosyltransferase family 39 protein [Chloroflexota bacterium]